MGVSRDFHDLAAAQLYRSIEYTFSDEENEHPVDLLAGVLETLASSEYSYASFVKEIHVTSTALGDRGERAYRDYLYTSSCGKFLNLTLLTVLKRVTVLESFDWDVRIELSPSVFSCLSNISSLRYLRVRLQAGRSLHSRSWTPHGNASIPNSHPPPPSGWNNAVVDAKVSSRPISGKRSKATASFSRFRNLTSFSALEIDTLEYVPELAKCIHASSKSLKRLALSFSENLARKAKEIQGGNSDTELTLSDGDLSDTGVQSSHHGNQEHSAETWQMARDAQEAALARMLGLQSLSESNPNATAVDKMVSHADKEVFDQLKQAYRKEKDKEFLSSIRNIMKTTSGLSDKKDSRSYRLVDRLERAATKYLESGDFSTKELRKRKDASVDKMMPKKPSPKPPKPYHYSTYTSGTQPGLSPGTYIPHQQPDEMWVTSNGTVLPTAGPSQPHHYSIPGPSSMSSKYFAAPASNWVPLPQKHPIYGPGYHLHPEASHTVASSSKSKKSIMSTSSSSSLLSGSSAQAKSSSPDPLPKPKERSPSSHQKHGDEKSVKTYDDGIDIDHPDDLGEDVEDQEFIENHATNIVLNETLELNKPESSDHNLPNGTALSPDSSLPSRQRKGKEVVRDQNSSFGSDRRVTNTFENSSESSSSTTKPESSSMTEYLRLSHGLALESIKLHRIPVKPSVLFRAVDVSRLKHLTLLDVGPQRAAWAMLSKLNKTSSLQLEIINTNNVTHSLLVFLNGLEPGKLQELYLLEPSSRHRSANTRKTLVTIREIRKQVLKKHIETLRILMIRNDDDNSWCLDREATRVLSRGSKLRELVVAMSSETFVRFFLPGSWSKLISYSAPLPPSFSKARSTTCLACYLSSQIISIFGSITNSEQSTKSSQHGGQSAATNSHATSTSALAVS